MAFGVDADIRTIDSLVTRNPHHAASTVLLLAKFNAVVNQPLFIFRSSYRTLNPARCNIVYSNTLLPARPTRGPHKSAKAIFGCCIFPIALNEYHQY